MQSFQRFSRRTWASLWAAAATMTWVLSSHAQTVGPSSPVQDTATMEAAFARADSNADGVLSAQEAARLPAIATQFAELDKNKDGVLSKAEFSVGYFSHQ